MANRTRDDYFSVDCREIGGSCRPDPSSDFHDGVGQLRQPLCCGCLDLIITSDHYASLEQLIGQDKQFILNKLGKPNQHLTDGTKEYYIYRDSLGGSTEVIFLAYMLLPFASETKGDLKCLLFIINDKNIIQEYQLKSAGSTDDLSMNNYDIYCKNAFWEKAQLKKIKSLSGT